LYLCGGCGPCGGAAGNAKYVGEQVYIGSSSLFVWRLQTASLAKKKWPAVGRSKGVEKMQHLER
jgi:hypothetical protein